MAGLLVADFSRILAGPYATMLLADLGRRGDQGRGTEGATTPGPGSRPSATASPPTTWASTATSARSPWTSPTRTTPPLARELAARADIVIENFRPGGLTRFGLDYETVAAAQPQDHLRLDQRLRQRREGRGAARLRPDRAGDLGPDEPDRRPGRAAVPGGDLGLRRDGRAARDHRRTGRAAPAPRDRPRPARRGQPALLRAVRAGQPLQRVRRRRHGARTGWATATPACSRTSRCPAPTAT